MFGPKIPLRRSTKMLFAILGVFLTVAVNFTAYFYLHSNTGINTEPEFNPKEAALISAEDIRKLKEQEAKIAAAALAAKNLNKQNTTKSVETQRPKM